MAHIQQNTAVALEPNKIVVEQTKVRRQGPSSRAVFSLATIEKTTSLGENRFG